MSETASAKEMDDRERFRPSSVEIANKRWALFQDGFKQAGADEFIDEWIEAETERRMTEACYDNGFPIRKTRP